MKENIIVTNNYISVTLANDKYTIPIGVAECSMSLDNKNLWYFNRLYVYPKYRRQGYGSKLLDKLLSLIKENNHVLQLDINPYGDMTYEQLEEFYMRHGFVKVAETNNMMTTYYYNAFIKGETDENKS